jgi:magnesium-transporting ATPase (P-type)
MKRYQTGISSFETLFYRKKGGSIMNLRNIYSAIVFIVIGVIFYYETLNFPNKTGSGDVGSAFWPRTIITIIIILSIILIITSIKDKATSEKNKKNTLADSLKKVVKPSIGIAICFVFLFLLKILGFVVTVFAMYVGLAALMYQKLDLKKLALLSSQALFLIIIMYFLFGMFLKVDLPRGVLF